MRPKIKYESLLRVPGVGARVWGTAIAVTVIGFILVLPLIPPPLPKVVRMATGPADGAYQGYGEKLKTHLAEQGITLELVQTRGSMENIDMLLDDANPVDLAFVQSGCMSDEQANRLQSVASLFYEPCLVFHRADVDPRNRKGLRVAGGRPGSGTYQLLNLLLPEGEVELVELGGAEAAAALQRGEVDAAAFVTTFDVDWLGALFEDDELKLLDFELAEAMIRHHRFLTQVKIPRGLYDLQRVLPPEDVTVIATTTSLVIRSDTHSGLIPLLIESSYKEVKGGTIFAEAGEFPSPHKVEAPLSEDAERYFRRGPSLLNRYLPFRVAYLIGRLSILILPLLTLLYPLFKSAGPLYRWLVMRRIYRWYRVLRALEHQIDTMETEEQRERIARDLDTIGREIRATQVPTRFAADLYQLRYHRRMLADRLGMAEEP